jgi:hypothetical protein
MDFVKTPMNFPQWEYNKEHLGQYSASLDTGLTASYTDDLKPNGIVVRWKYNARTEQGELLNCVAEDYYGLKDVAELELEDLQGMLKNSYSNFQHYFDERLGAEDIRLQIPSPHADTASLQLVLAQLKGQVGNDGDSSGSEVRIDE